MKGIVFTEFLNMIEENFGYEMVDYIIENSGIESKGIYTSVGTYSADEMKALISCLSTKTNVPTKTLLFKYGRFLHGTFTNKYIDFFVQETNSFDFLEKIDSHIHTEVKKIYPDAELPHFETNRIDSNTLEMIYTSKRKMSDFAEGLIKETLNYYNEDASIISENLEGEGEKVRFVIKIH